MGAHKTKFTLNIGFGWLLLVDKKPNEPKVIVNLHKIFKTGRFNINTERWTSDNSL